MVPNGVLPALLILMAARMIPYDAMVTLTAMTDPMNLIAVSS